MNVSVSQVKELRERTGAAMIECKKALVETGGDLEAAVSHLKKKGLLDAEKKSGREAREGLIEAYIHPGSRVGVLVEVNCETDFVARTDEFKNLVRNIALQIAALSPVSVGRDAIPADILEKEKARHREEALALGKPANVVEKIVEGRMEKFYTEICLLDQLYIRDPEKKVSDLIKEHIATLGENIVVRKFSRFALGE
ncbi:MAG: translation elongation factor Ts [Candidatus Eisenbacteria bacterium]|nr:translation elongation factor Ts [Candidatus Eisenbacteria bacterium]